MENLTVPSLQQNICDVRANLRTPRNRQQMRRRLGRGDFDKIFVVEACRLRQYWFCNRDVVIASETAHDFDGGIIDWSKAPAQFGERLCLYSLDEVAQDVIENVDLLIVKPIGVRNKEIGDTPQRVDTFVFGAAIDRVFQLRNK